MKLKTQQSNLLADNFLFTFLNSASSTTVILLVLREKISGSTFTNIVAIVQPAQIDFVAISVTVSLAFISLSAKSALGTATETRRKKWPNPTLTGLLQLFCGHALQGHQCLNSARSTRRCFFFEGIRRGCLLLYFIKMRPLFIDYILRIPRR